MTERCNTCNAVLLWANHRLVCPRPHCPGPRGEPLPLTPCRNEGCTARIDATHMPGGLCGECFRRLPSTTRKQATAEQHRRRATAAVKS